MRHTRLISKSLRTLADTIDGLREPREFRTVYATLDRVRDLINVCLYNHQKKLLQGVAYDMDPIEVADMEHELHP